MGLRELTVIACLGIVFAFAAPHGASEAASLCLPHAGERKTLANRLAVVYENRRGRTVGCFRASGRGVLIFKPYSGWDTTRRKTFLALRGRHAAVEWVLSDRDDTSYGLRIIDLRRGKTRHRVSPFEVELPAADSRRPAVQQIAITRRGHAAWIARSLGSPEIRLHVYKVDREGMDLLDAGPGVDRESLRVSRRGLVQWRANGARRTHQLTPDCC